ncbi:hypothetical protein NPIL_43891 [Nephila pilipes]|uniref:Uncharacterized protein n=1 Tax=Nephila pilipes TaxID=299642 RepID=A0A8X6T4C4_NEPPI|nr:hypothetical protein NPIL_43891 [Nephila pilipes]
MPTTWGSTSKSLKRFAMFLLQHVQTLGAVWRFSQQRLPLICHAAKRLAGEVYGAVLPDRLCDRDVDTDSILMTANTVTSSKTGMDFTKLKKIW